MNSQDLAMHLHFVSAAHGSGAAQQINTIFYFHCVIRQRAQAANIVIVGAHISRMSFRWNGNILLSAWHVWSQLEPPINTIRSGAFVGHACRMHKQGQVQSRVQCINVIFTKWRTQQLRNKTKRLNFALQLFCSLSTRTPHENGISAITDSTP